VSSILSGGSIHENIILAQEMAKWFFAIKQTMETFIYGMEYLEVKSVAEVLILLTNSRKKYNASQFVVL
jgi:hypothetical protein